MSASQTADLKFTLTDEVKAEILSGILRGTPEGMAELVVDAFANAKFAVVPDYITDGPGYAGPVVFVVYGGGPELFDVLARAIGNRWEVIASTVGTTPWHKQ